MSSTRPDPSGPDLSGSGPGRPDPAEAFATAMRDLWDLGAAMLQSAATGAAPGRDPQEGAFGVMAAPAAGMLSAYAEMMARLAGGRGTPLDAAQGTTGQAVDLSPALAEAASVAMGSALRYGQGLAEVFARHQGNLLKAAAARMAGEATLPPEECRAAAEELRAFLRDISDTAMLEARRLEHELAQVSETIAQIAAPSSPDDRYKRRWAAKP
jgi:hypothetical protein